MADIVPTLVDLAARINEEHQLAETAFREGLTHAKAAGELLLQAKAKCQHGEWLPWLKANVSFSERTARNYIRVADRWGELVALNRQRVADLSYRDAINLLTDHRADSDQQAEVSNKTTLYERMRYRTEATKPVPARGNVFAVTEESITIAGRVFHTPLASFLWDLDGELWGRFVESVEERGFVMKEAAFVDEHDNVIDGRQRLRAAAELRLAEVPITVCEGVTPEDKAHLFISANFIRTGMFTAERPDHATLVARLQ
jgi:ParB-like chromosome segregation protein Spo0J